MSAPCLLFTAAITNETTASKFVREKAFNGALTVHSTCFFLFSDPDLEFTLRSSAVTKTLENVISFHKPCEKSPPRPGNG